MNINKYSSHPKKIIKQITKITNRYFNKRPNNKKIIKTKHEYDLIMEKCGCNNKLNFEINQQKPITNNKCKRNIILYNPLFSSLVRKNIDNI